jgi:hypothetical protein
MVVALVDRIGYLWCSDCAARLDKVGRPVYHDAAPHNAEACDHCERVVNQPKVATAA